MVYIKVLCGIGHHSGNAFIRFQPAVHPVRLNSRTSALTAAVFLIETPCGVCVKGRTEMNKKSSDQTVERDAGMPFFASLLFLSRKGCICHRKPNGTTLTNEEIISSV